MSLPLDILYIIAEQSPRSTRARLSRCSWALHFLCDTLLYRQNDNLNNSSVVFDIIHNSPDTTTAVTALRKAYVAGADLNTYRPMRVRDISQDIYVQYVTSPIRTDSVIDVAPLQLAAARGLDEVIAFLIDCGVDVDTTAGTSPWTPFCLAVYFDNLSTASLLLAQGAGIQTKRLGFHTLHLAAATGSEDMTRLLLNTGRVHVDEEDVGGNTALVYALSSTNLPYGTQLTRAAGFRSGIWGSALMSSVGGGLDQAHGVIMTNLSPTVRQRRMVIELLLSEGADASKECSMPDDRTAPVLLKLCWSANLWGARYLLEHGLVRADECLEQLRSQRDWMAETSTQAAELLHEFSVTA